MKSFGDKQPALGDLMKKAQEMQKQMQEIQKQIANMKMKGVAGGDMVTAVMSGRYELIELTINPSLLKEEPSIIEDLIKAAVNMVVKQI